MEKRIAFSHVEHVWKKLHLTDQVTYRARLSIWGISNTFITSREAELVFHSCRGSWRGWTPFLLFPTTLGKKSEKGACMESPSNIAAL